MIKFDNITLGAFSSIHSGMLGDHERILTGLEKIDQELASQERSCKDEINLRWIQGARQYGADLIEAIRSAREVVRREYENAEERKRTVHVKGSAFG